MSDKKKEWELIPKVTARVVGTKYPKKFDHFIVKDKCPKCDGELHAKILEKGCVIWCTNHPNCDYQTYGDSDKARELIFEKHGIKVTVVHKAGACVIFSNRPIPKNHKKQ